MESILPGSDAYKLRRAPKDLRVRILRINLECGVNT
jgi:hypothetical protein